jgi:Mg-chelatase subunit ChlD
LDDLIDFGGSASIDLSSGAAMPASGTAGTSFFGLEARGSRIVYIVDVSGSMYIDDRLATLKQQLIDSLRELPEHGHFAIVTFQSVPRALMGRGWTAATRANKSAAEAEIENLQAAGGTVPGPAFQVAFDLSPRPDAVYFMTDGEFPQYEQALMGDIEVWNRRGRRPTPIHCITFGTDAASAVMRRIAERSGGGYVHVESVP